MKTPTCTYHCSPCGAHFTSLRAFDAHRSGPYENRLCNFPDDHGLVDREGVCNLSGPSRPVTLYEHESASLARTHFQTERPSDSSQSVEAGA